MKQKITNNLRDKIEDILDDNIKTIPFEGEDVDRRQIIEDIIVFLRDNYNMNPKNKKSI